MKERERYKQRELWPADFAAGYSRGRFKNMISASPFCEGTAETNSHPSSPCSVRRVLSSSRNDGWLNALKSVFLTMYSHFCMAPPPKGPSGDYLSVHSLSIILISPIRATEFSISTTYILYFPASIVAQAQDRRTKKKSTLPPMLSHQSLLFLRGLTFCLGSSKIFQSSFLRRRFLPGPQ